MLHSMHPAARVVSIGNYLRWLWAQLVATLKSELKAHLPYTKQMPVIKINAGPEAPCSPSKEADRAYLDAVADDHIEIPITRRCAWG